ncbi:hypothetical protein NQ314_001995 [Rhamnusium bicolor]|uniref:GCN5-related N-acetyltransferase Rv2170-like domain-containing protein n=1 Tax=Rhamnusium bicolor TaxID=1586634 RepID=A0AAV8ZRK7_9CUCU|nr:hypothetical protein NQ314_001995 [Rhamnusium bicolor]
MSEAEDDILVDIADEDLPKLAKIYESHKDWAPHAYSTITTGIEWKKKSGGKYMTFIFDVFIFTLNETGENVYDALMKTRRLETNFSDRPRLFYSIHNKLYPAVFKALKERKIEIYAEIPCYLYAIPKEEALKFDVECPPEVYIKQLDKTDAPVISALWPHRYKNADKFVEILIEMNGGYGIFLKSSNELVSWALLSMMGQLSLVQTVDDQKKKGYASLITKYLSKELAKKGHDALGTILVENIVSQMMFEKLGFRSLGLCTFTLFR